MKVSPAIFLFFILCISYCQNLPVDCPDPTINPSYLNCLECKTNISSNSIFCSCHKTNIHVIGRCIIPNQPCSSYGIFQTYWRSVAKEFWVQKFIDARAVYSDPDPLPSFINSFDFNTMPQNYRFGWTQAYFVYKTMEPNFGGINILENIFPTVVFIESILNHSYIEMQSQILSYINTKLSKNWTKIQFQTMIDDYFSRNIQCSYCKSGYGLMYHSNSSNQLMICSKCTQNCVNCYNDICSDCENKYGIMEDNSSKIICSRCPPNCGYCRSSSSCDSCYFEYFLNNQTKVCEPCEVLNCWECSSPSNCHNCRDGYNLINNKCIEVAQQKSLTPCIENSNNPNNPCTLCVMIDQLNSFWPNSQGKCYPCTDILCMICNEGNSSICSSCSTQYYLSFSNKCEPCPENCIQCSENRCLICIYGYGASSNGTCELCKINKCLSCQNNTSSCDRCLHPSVYNNQSNTCVQPNNQIAICPLGCAQCYENNTRNCFSCQKGYYMDDQNKLCKKCQPFCGDCANQNKCKKCMSYYTLSSNICVRCPEKCIQCDSSNTSLCLVCQYGSFLFKNQCSKIENPSCFQFDKINQTKCILCKNGFTLHPNGLCMQCSTDCLYTCNPLNITQCRKSKYLIQISFTFKNHFQFEGCAVTNNNNCYSSLPGYHLQYVNSKGVAIEDCPLYCLTCKSSICLSCVSGYVLQGQKCRPDLSCNPSCTFCPFQSSRNSSTNNCELCPLENCGNCNNGVCIQCGKGYYLQNGICKPCHANCKVCVAQQLCKICKKQYLIHHSLMEPQNSYGKCIPCDQNCRTCYSVPSACSSCREGKKLRNARCVSLIRVTYIYRLDIDYLIFQTMASSFSFIQELSQMLNISESQISIQSITQGSTIVLGSVSAINEQDASVISKKIQTGSLRDFPFLGVSTSIVINDEVISCVSSCPSTQTQPLLEKSNLGLIIGLSVGLPVLVLIIMFATIFLMKKYRKAEHSPIIPEPSGKQMV